jgi:hypothetical protein
VYTVPDTLTVHVNRETLHSLEVPEGFAVTEGFDVRLVNHGESTHVHLHLDDSLSALASIAAPNHHLKRDSERWIGVTVSEPGQTRGNLKIVTGYGATTRYVDLTVSEPSKSEQSVEVAEELTTPQPASEGDDLSVSWPMVAGCLGLLFPIVTGITVAMGWGVAVVVVAVAAVGAGIVWSAG